MDCVSTRFDDLPYADQPPVILVADSQRALQNARRTVDSAGYRSAVAESVAVAPERIENQAAASAIWMEIDQDPGPQFETLAALIRRDVGKGRYAAVVATTASLIDPVFSALGDIDAQILVDPDDAQRTAALALAVLHRTEIQRLSDVASDQSSARLRQLSEEVNRIAATLARLSSSPVAAATSLPVEPGGDIPPVGVETVRTIIRARRLRARFFDEELFADPAWDMLLDLLQAEIAQLRVPVSSLCIAAAVPATTALRWLKTLVDRGLFVRRADPHDGRRVFVELAPDTSKALRRYFAEVSAIGAI